MKSSQLDRWLQGSAFWIFWLGSAILFYTYLGYGALLFLLVRLRGGDGQPASPALPFLPPVTLVVPAYNEEEHIVEKLENCLRLDYPRDLLTILFVIDGSTDRSRTVLDAYPLPGDAQFQVLHEAERRGKLAAVDRAMTYVNTPVVVFSDANTRLNSAALRNMVRHFVDPSVGAVAGEKRVHAGAASGAEGAGEGLYWRYESALKRLDGQLYSVVGAAGELFAIRTALYETVPPDSIIEDFHLSMRIVMRGNRVAYEPEAYALEGHSVSVGEELKRKVRIAAGGLQSVSRLLPLLNPAQYGVLTFQYVSHRVLRWTLAPLLLPLVLGANLALVGSGMIYRMALSGQVLFYGMALLGLLLDRLGMKPKLFLVPFYFCMMNYAVFAGAWRLLRGRQSAVWEKARRA